MDITNTTFYNHVPTGLSGSQVTGTVTNATFVSSAPQPGPVIDNSLFVNTTCYWLLQGSNNLQWPPGAACTTGVIFADPNLSAIGNHGGPTPTVLPEAGGAAMGIGTNCPPTDQRGQPRSTSSCTAGSVEP